MKPSYVIPRFTSLIVVFKYACVDMQSAIIFYIKKTRIFDAPSATNSDCNLFESVTTTVVCNYIGIVHCPAGELQSHS